MVGDYTDNVTRIKRTVGVTDYCVNSQVTDYKRIVVLRGFFRTAEFTGKKDLMDNTDLIVIMDKRCIFMFA